MAASHAGRTFEGDDSGASRTMARTTARGGTTLPKIHDVLINGCGPTGLATALLLARLGHSVAIVDRHQDIYPLPRAVAFDHEVARILNMLGLSGEIGPLVAIPGIYQWRNQHNDLLFELNWSASASVSGFATSYLFSQPQLEAVLNASARANPLIAIHRGVDVDAIAQDGDGVTLTGQSVSGAVVSLRGRWLVGADGANSITRQTMGSTLQDLGFAADWLVVDIRSKGEKAIPLDDDLMLQVCDPARPTTVVSGGPGRRRWEFMALVGETLDQLNHADRAWELLRPWGVSPDNAVLERHAVYTFRGALADRWRNGRLLIAGDAAHLTPPFAGQGLCAGFRDAAALAWRLDLTLRGIAGPALLDSYESERKDHARAWIFNAIELGKVICVLDPEAAAQRDAGMKAAREAGAAPPSSAILPRLGPGINLDDRHGGTLAVGGQVGYAGKLGHFDDVIGTGFVLLARGADPMTSLSPQSAALFQGLGGIAVGFGTDCGADDVAAAYGRWFDELDVDTVLVRPDFYVFGTAKGANGADSLVQALAARIVLPVADNTGASSLASAT
jgi:2-polyprenyl-6-methoxyphenol hydroxylase-like FAD-dependent oxidoreductase